MKTTGFELCRQSQIPEPLSEEKIREMAEKKKAALKAKRDRLKEKKKQEEIEKKEKEERARFLALSDREKVNANGLVSVQSTTHFFSALICFTL